MKFHWVPDKAALNIERHQVNFEEAVEAFFDPNALDDYDEEHSDDEARFNLIGLSSCRLLFIVYTEPEPETIRIISARKADGKYKKLYEQPQFN